MTPSQNFFFDLDGTLIDSRKRLFALFCHLTKQSQLTFDDYWELKRAMYGHEWILKKYFNYDETAIQSFQKQWMACIECKEYLALDTVFPTTFFTLEKLKNKSLYIVTARQSVQNTLWQLDKLSILPYFKQIIITEQKLDKHELITQYQIHCTPHDFFIGDTGQDIQTAQALNIQSVAVLSGFRNASMLKFYKPNYLFNTIEDILTLL